MQFYRDEDGVWCPVPKPVPLSVLIRGAVLNALAYTDGHQTQAARLLGITQRQIGHAMKKYGIPSDASNVAHPRNGRRGHRGKR